MLELRPNCECCNKDLPPDSKKAVICTFECTFCLSCSENILKKSCPNCGGNLVERPIRPSKLLERNPASTHRIVKDTRCKSTV